MPAATNAFIRHLKAAPFPDGRHGPAAAYNDSSVLFIVPGHFDVSRPFDVVVYLHGWYTDIAEQYRVGTGDRIWYGLDKQVESTGRNVLLLAPQLPKSIGCGDPGKLQSEGGAKAFLAEARDVLAQEFDKEPAFSIAFDAASLIVVSYSGGYRAAACFVEQAFGVPDRVKAVLMLDSLYGQQGDFAGWLETRKAHIAFVSLAIQSKDKENTLDPSIALLEQLGGSKNDVLSLPVQPPRLGAIQVYRTKANHPRVPIEGPPEMPLTWFLDSLPAVLSPPATDSSPALQVWGRNAPAGARTHPCHPQREATMSNLGQDIIDVGRTRIGETYVLGANVPLDNPNWHGPWDCAEFASWCAFQAYGLIFGAGNPRKISDAEPYSGHWFSEAKKSGQIISWQQALTIAGAVLIRAPASGKIGHVAFSLGDGDTTLEAKGAAFGVGLFKNAASRPWSIGCLLPGVDYATGATPPVPLLIGDAHPPLPPEFLSLAMPRLSGAHVVALQRALRANGLDPGPIDGIFGSMTNSAILTLQVMKGLEVDGVVGANTARALGLAFPIQPAAGDQQILADAESPKGPPSVPLPPANGAFDGIADIQQAGKSFHAKTASGFSFIIGSSTSYTDDMNRVGLFQGSSTIPDSIAKFGVYKAADFKAAFGQWAYFIEPTLSAEGGARFATLNSYDRAAFTFGAPQLAAHTPNANFIVYLRLLLALPDATKHFPELSLQTNAAGKKSVHLDQPGGRRDLEEVVEVTRPNGKKERQLAHLMAYLNPSPTRIDAAELSAAARLMNWLWLDQDAKKLQIEVFIQRAKGNLAAAKTKIAGFTGDDWRIALWIMDILHQGRGTYIQMSAAVSSGDPVAGLMEIGSGTYDSRIEAVRAASKRLEVSGVLNGFKV